MNVTGKECADVLYSTQFLAEARDYARGTSDMPCIHESVAVIGGGDVSFDVARTLARLQNIQFGKVDVQFIARKNEENLAASREEVIEAREENVTYNLDRCPVEIVMDEEKQ